MASFNAKQLFTCENPDMVRSRMVIATMQIMQAKVRVHYTLLMNTKLIWTSRIPTAATDGYYVYVNEQFFRSLPNDNQRAFLFAHEVSHIILQHPQRGKAYMDRGYVRTVGNSKIPFNPHFYNCDADAVTNADLIAMGLEMIPAGILRDDVDRNMFVDDIYLARDWNQPEQPEQPQPEPDNGDDDGDQGGSDGQSDDQPTDDADQSSDDGDDQQGNDDAGGAGGDDDSSDQPVDDSDPLDGATSEGHDTHLVPQYDGDSDEDIVDQIKADVESVERVIDQALDDLARSEDNEGHKQVNTSESIAQSGGRVRAINASSVDWRSALADRATAMSAGEESSWKRINRRRLVNTGVISPSKIGTFNRIGITVDTSWSCMRYESTVSAFFNEAASLIDTLAPRSGAVLVQCGESVRQVDEPMSGSEFLDVDVSMGGGTYMAASVEWMEANGVDCDIHLIFTDGEMCDEDYRICAESDAILILVKHPDFWTRKMIDESGIDYIVASDDPLAA